MSNLSNSASTPLTINRLVRGADGDVFYDGQRVQSTMDGFDDSIILLIDGPQLITVSRSEWFAVQPIQTCDHPLAQALAPLTSSRLECDGLSKAIATVFHLADVPHTLYAGRLVYHRTGESVPIHYWLTLPTGECVDFRARMWLGEHTDVPHGIFAAGDFPAVQYQGVPIVEPYWSTELFLIITGRDLAGLVTAVQQLRT